MPTTITAPSEIKTPREVLQAIAKHLEAVSALITRAEFLAAKQCEEGASLDAFRSSTEDLWAAIQDQAEPALSVALAAELEMVDRGAVTYGEHVAQERRAYLARVA